VNHICWMRLATIRPLYGSFIAFVVFRAICFNVVGNRHIALVIFNKLRP